MSATTSSANARSTAPYYFVPAPSHFPIMLATALLFIITGAAQWINGAGWGGYMLLGGFLLLAFILQGWFRQAISESEDGLYGDRVDGSFRWSMSWFIYSEVMFFAAFFGALILVRLSVGALGSERVRRERCRKCC
jgi:cytochrome c oxidase subunit 3